MDNKAYTELIEAITEMEHHLRELRQKVDKAVPRHQWLTTHQFAKRTGLKPKTVSNYAGKGKFNQVKKTANGQYLIHKNELSLWA